MIISRALRALALSLAAVILAGCLGTDSTAKHLRPLSYATKAELREKGMRQEDPILVRIFKEEGELELWKKRSDGRFAHFRTYEICAWSGELGPKHREGDRQAPEGFYSITPAQMNPNSSYHLAFNLGFPNNFDRSHGRTGSHLMVHGACSSAGCYAMTDESIEEIYAFAREAFRGGQRDFQVQAFPFRMTPENMARHADNPNMPFWRNLKLGSDHFEVTGRTPEVGVCDRQYVFNASPADPAAQLVPTAACPRLEVPAQIEQAVAARQMRDETRFQVALAEIRSRDQQPVEMTDATVMLAYEDLNEQGSTPGYEAAEAPDLAEPVAASPVAAFSEVGDTVTNVWNRLVGFTRPGPLAPAAAASDDAVPAQGETDASNITTASASFAPTRLHRDVFAVFSLFETVDGASMPADMVRR